MRIQVSITEKTLERLDQDRGELGRSTYIGWLINKSGIGVLDTQQKVEKVTEELDEVENELAKRIRLVVDSPNLSAYNKVLALRSIDNHRVKELIEDYADDENMELENVSILDRNLQDYIIDSFRE